MENKDLWWNDTMEISLMNKHAQVIKHFEKKYQVNANRILTFEESKSVSEALRKIKFLKLRNHIDTNKAQTLFKLITSLDEESSNLGHTMVIQFMKKIEE